MPEYSAFLGASFQKYLSLLQAARAEYSAGTKSLLIQTNLQRTATGLLVVPNGANLLKKSTESAVITKFAVGKPFLLWDGTMSHLAMRFPLCCYFVDAQLKGRGAFSFDGAAVYTRDANDLAASVDRIASPDDLVKNQNAVIASQKLDTVTKINFWTGQAMLGYNSLE